jgi:hypothetical protein
MFKLLKKRQHKKYSGNLNYVLRSINYDIKHWVTRQEVTNNVIHRKKHVMILYRIYHHITTTSANQELKVDIPSSGGHDIINLCRFFNINSVQAETGKGDDIFKVITTIFGVDESKGDVIAIVTVKDEQARVKLFDASGPEVVPLNASEGGGHLIEYVATFPNLTVNAGDEYKACIATVKDLELICKSGNNSPAARPKFVDISLNATTTADIQQETTEEGDAIESDNDNEGE